MATERSTRDDGVVPFELPGRGARTVLVVTALVVAAAAVPARAQAPPPVPPPPAAAPDERAAAREFSFAAYRLRVAVLGQKAAIEAKIAAGLAALDDPRCDRVLAAAPARSRPQVLLMTVLLAALPTFDPLRAPLERYLAELERVPTADPLLRSGRAGWRSQVELIRRLPSIPDPCAALEAWQRAGFAPGAVPVDPAALDNPGLDAADAKLRRAARRMRELGVGAPAARRFTGDTLLDGIG
jgi:hypothetical protein